MFKAQEEETSTSLFCRQSLLTPKRDQIPQPVLRRRLIVIGGFRYPK